MINAGEMPTLANEASQQKAAHPDRRPLTPRGPTHEPPSSSASSASMTGSSAASASRSPHSKPPRIPRRPRAPAGGMSSAAPPPCSSCCRSSPASCSRWSTRPPRARPGPASSSSTTTSRSAGCLRAIHGWGSDFMVAIVLIHMVQVFLFGAYKYPRELTWILGVFLLLLTLGMAFTGQVLRFDQDAYWGLGIGASIISRVPWIGGQLVHLHARRPHHRRRNPLALLRAPRLRHSRHAARLRRSPCLDGPPPRRQRVAHARPHRPQSHLRPRVPRAHRQRPACPSSPTPHGKTPSSPPPSSSPSSPAPSSSAPSAPAASPTPPSSRPRPSPTSSSSGSTRSSPTCRPSLKRPSSSSRPWSSSAPCLLLPLVAGEGEKHWSRRPVAVLMVSVIAVTLAVFTHLGTYTPWSPIMNAWTGDPTPTAVPQRPHAARAPGRASCSRTSSAATATALGGVGGQRGPALDAIATA